MCMHCENFLLVFIQIVQQVDLNSASIRLILLNLEILPSVEAICASFSNCHQSRNHKLTLLGMEVVHDFRVSTEH